jgi:Protein of unknown function (DUF3667)
MLSPVCKNCSSPISGKYCANCGQSAHVERIDAHYFLHDIPHSIFHIDKGFFYTLSRLFTNPGKALGEYLAGKRVNHFRPFGFVIIMSTICTLIIKGIEKGINYKLIKEGVDFQIGATKNFFANYPSILIFILIPLLSLVTWFFYKRKKYNYWEHFLVNTYIAAFLNVFFLIIGLYQFIRYYITDYYGQVNYGFFIALFMAYYGYAFGILMEEPGSRLRNIFINLAMNFFLAFIYLNAFTFTKIMTPWWGK